jgi:hypothetical protein
VVGLKSYVDTYGIGFICMFGMFGLLCHFRYYILKAKKMTTERDRLSRKILRSVFVEIEEDVSKPTKLMELEGYLKDKFAGRKKTIDISEEVNSVLREFVEYLYLAGKVNRDFMEELYNFLKIPTNK